MATLNFKNPSFFTGALKITCRSRRHNKKCALQTSKLASKPTVVENYWNEYFYDTLTSSHRVSKRLNSISFRLDTFLRSLISHSLFLFVLLQYQKKIIVHCFMTFTKNWYSKFYQEKSYPNLRGKVIHTNNSRKKF